MIIRPRFEPAIRAARHVHPDLGVSDEQLAAFLAQRVDAGELDEAAALVNAGDLLLCCAVLGGEPAAHTVFEAVAIAPLDGSVSRIVGDGSIAEVKQRVRDTLLVAKPGALPRLSGYAGRGPLRAWVRAVAIRLALRVRHESHGVDELDLELFGTEDDPALQILRDRYAGELRAAFEVALRELDPKDRTLLRQQFVDGLGTEALAVLHRVHRVTMFRRLGKVRRRLLAATRRELGARIGVKHSELDSLMRAVKSNVELTLERVLASES